MTDDAVTRSIGFKKSNFGFKNLVGVAMVFGLFGFGMMQVFADTAVATTQAEDLTGSGRVVSVGGWRDKKRKGLQLWNSTPAIGKITNQKQGTTVKLIAKGVRCKGAPTLSLVFDGKEVMKANVASSLWKTYISETPIAPGEHTVTVSLLNPSGPDACARTLYLDNITITDNRTPESKHDAQAPTVSITTPIDASTVKGTVDIAAKANDNAAVTKVEFYVFEQSVTTPLATITAKPFSYSFNSSSLANGDYTLFVKAYDQAGNATTSANTRIYIANGR